MAPPSGQKKVSVSFTNWMLGGNLISVDKNGNKIFTDGRKFRKPSPKVEAEKKVEEKKVEEKKVEEKKVEEKKAGEKKAEEKPKEKGILKKATEDETEDEYVVEVKRVCGCCGKTKIPRTPEKEIHTCAKHRGEKEAAKKDSKDDTKEDEKAKKGDSKDKAKGDVKEDEKAGKNGKGGFEWTDAKDKQLLGMVNHKKPWDAILKTVKTNKENCEERLKVLQEVEKDKAKKEADEAAIKALNDATEAAWDANLPKTDTNIGFGAPFDVDADTLKAISGNDFAGDNQNPGAVKSSWDTSAPTGDAWPTKTDNTKKDEPAAAPADDWNSDNVHATKPDAATATTSWDTSSDKKKDEAAATTGAAWDSGGKKDGPAAASGGWDSNAPVVPVATEAKTGDGGSWDTKKTEKKTASDDWNADNPHATKPDAITSIWDTGGPGTGDGAGSSVPASWDSPSAGSGDKGKQPEGKEKTSDGCDSNPGDKKDDAEVTSGDSGWDVPTKDSSGGDDKKTEEKKAAPWNMDGANDAKPASSGDDWNSDNVHAPQKPVADTSNSWDNNNGASSGTNNASNTSGWDTKPESNDTPAEQNTASNGWDNPSGANNASGGWDTPVVVNNVSTEQNNSSNGWDTPAANNVAIEPSNTSVPGAWDSTSTTNTTQTAQTNSWDNAGSNNTPPEKNKSSGDWNDTNVHANNQSNGANGATWSNSPPQTSNSGNNPSQGQNQNVNNGNAQNLALNNVLAQGGFTIQQNDRGELIITQMGNNIGTNMQQASAPSVNNSQGGQTNTNWQNAAQPNGTFVPQQQPIWSNQVSLYPQDEMINSLVRGEGGYWVHNSLYNQIRGQDPATPVVTQHGPPPTLTPAPNTTLAPLQASPVGNLGWITHPFRKVTLQPVTAESPPVQQPQPTPQPVAPSPIGTAAHIPWPYRAASAQRVPSGPPPTPTPTPAPQPEVPAEPALQWVGPGMNSWVRTPQPPPPSDEPQWIGSGSQNPHWMPAQSSVLAPSSVWPGASMPQQQTVPDVGPKPANTGLRSSSGGGIDPWSSHSAYSRDQVQATPPAPAEPLVSAFGDTSSTAYPYHTPGTFPSSPGLNASKSNSGCLPTPTVKHLKPDNMWSQTDCEILEHLAARHRTMMFDFITERFHKLTHKVVSPQAVERKFREDGLL